MRRVAVPHLLDPDLELPAEALRLPPIDPERLLTALRRVTGDPALDFAEAPSWLGSGGEAVVETFRLAGGAAPFDGPLVLRRLLPLKDPTQVRKEAAVHAALVEQGFPVPRVLHADSDAGAVGAPYLVAQRLPGRILLEEVTRPGELTRHPLRIPRLVHQALTSVPRLLGELQARLHALDPEPLRRRLAKGGFDPEQNDFPGRLSLLASRIDRNALDGLAAGLEWLRANRPADERRVICHGDFVFTNVCVDGGRVTGVFDWSNTAFADPAYDVAASLARLESNVPGIPAWLARVMRSVQAILVRRYLAWYRRSGAAEPERVRYYEAYWLLHELVWSGERQRAGFAADGTIEHRWLYPETIARGVDDFEKRTGVRLAPLLPDAS